MGDDSSVTDYPFRRMRLHARHSLILGLVPALFMLATLRATPARNVSDAAAANWSIWDGSVVDSSVSDALIAGSRIPALVVASGAVSSGHGECGGDVDRRPPLDKPFTALQERLFAGGPDVLPETSKDRASPAPGMSDSDAGPHLARPSVEGGPIISRLHLFCVYRL